MELENLISIAKHGEITAFVGDIIDINGQALPHFKPENNTVVEYFSGICDKDKLLKALPVLNLKPNVINSSLRVISNSLKNKLAVIEALVSKEDVLIFNDVHKSLTYREIQNVKRILNKLAEHNKKVIILTNDAEFLFGLTKVVYGVKTGVLKDLSPVNWFHEDVYNYVSKPPIIEFVLNCKRRNIKIDNCYETKELLKAIYRSVSK